MLGLYLGLFDTVELRMRISTFVFGGALTPREGAAAEMDFEEVLRRLSEETAVLGNLHWMLWAEQYEAVLGEKRVCRSA